MNHILILWTVGMIWWKVYYPLTYTYTLFLLKQYYDKKNYNAWNQIIYHYKKINLLNGHHQYYRFRSDSTYNIMVYTHKIGIISGYVLFFLLKVIDNKLNTNFYWFNDDIELGISKYLYVSICHLQHIIINIYW